MLELLATDQFIDAVQDVDMKLQVRQPRIKNLWEALQSALELEAFELASQSRAAPAKDVNLEDGTTFSEAMNDCIQQCTDAFYFCLKREYPDAIT